jgi:peptidoglycan L-alanyl-D-glutamate endopeptidase CwlK
MFLFGKSSREKLLTCDPALRAVATRALELSPVDFTIIYGWRDQATQNALVASGNSKTPWPTSKHNAVNSQGPCSRAIDFAPVSNGRIDWKDTHMFALVAGVLFAAAKERGVKLRWGGDWDSDGNTTDQKFMDWGHIELLD